MSGNKALKSTSFEAALEELEGIVRSLETGQTSLDQSITAYERGVALRAHCEDKLREARTKIETITVDSDGAVALRADGEQTQE